MADIPHSLGPRRTWGDTGQLCEYFWQAQRPEFHPQNQKLNYKQIKSSA